jgi:hypothetical protein
MMFVQSRNVLFAICVLTLVSLACVYLIPDEKLYYPNPEEEVSGEILEQWDATATVIAAATRAPRLTVAADQGQTGVCRWRNYEITPPAGSTSNPNMEIDVSHPTSINTTLKHGVSGCPDQFFYTQHYWMFPEVMHPGESQRLEVGFEWLNKGTADCAALVAGGVTTLTVADVKLRAENMSINVKTDPQGILSDSTAWVAPQGNPGDKFSLVVHASTGSYGTNVRYHFEYVCD